MRKILAGMLAGAMVLVTLTGCSGGKEKPAVSGETAAQSAGTEAAEKEKGNGETKTLDVAVSYTHLLYLTAGVS